MSQQAVNEFWSKLSNDTALRTEFDALLSASGDVPAREIVALGAKSGLAFSEDELKVSLKKAAGAELSDEELDSVAAGYEDVWKTVSHKVSPVSQTAFKITSLSDRFGIITF